MDERIMAGAPDIKLIVTDGDGCMLPLGSLPDRKLVKKLSVAMRLGMGYTDLALVTANSYGSECVRLASKIGITAYFEMGNKMLHEGEVSLRVGADDMEFLRMHARPVLDRLLLSEFPEYTRSILPQGVTAMSCPIPASVDVTHFSSRVEGIIANGADRSLSDKLLVSGSSDRFVYVTFKGSGKAEVLEGLLRGRERGSVMYVGDGAADIPAFKAVAGHGGLCIAPENAEPEVKRLL